ncbi:Hypothetical predicted protein, partial [Paramuricea clavata]
APKTVVSSANFHISERVEVKEIGRNSLSKDFTALKGRIDYICNWATGTRSFRCATQLLHFPPPISGLKSIVFDHLRDTWQLLDDCNFAVARNGNIYMIRTDEMVFAGSYHDMGSLKFVREIQA